MQRKIIRQYYVLSCMFNAGGMSVISAIYATFLIHNGLNLFQVNLVNSVFYITLFVCEIPTGAFADIFGRKTSFIAACGIMCVSMFIYGCSHTFLGFAAAEMLGAVGVTFKSGAFQAWLVDSLKHHGYDGEYHRIFGRGNLFNQIGGGVGAIVGSYLAVHNPALPWFIGGTSLAVTTICASIIMKEEYFVRGEFSWKRGLTSMRDIAVKSMRYGTDNKAVRFILIITCIQIFAVMPMNMYWQPFFREHRLGEQHLGYLFTALMAAVATGALIISKCDCKGNEKIMILRAQIIAGVLVIAAAITPGLPFMLVLFVLHEVPRGCWNPLIDSYLQKRIPSKERATIASFCAIAPHIGGAVGLLASGVVAQCFGISAAWMLSGLVLIVGALCVSKNGSEKEYQ